MNYKNKVNKVDNVFVRNLLEAVSMESGCEIQHNGCPCNTCFHSWAEDKLKLNRILAHMFWMVVCALRGDYKQDEILDNNEENLIEWSNEINERKYSK
jgi:hypothetical protein